MTNETPQELPKKRGRKPNPDSPVKRYFGEKQEEAIKKYLTVATVEEKNILFRDIIDPALRQLVKGVLRMPKFQKIIGLTIPEVEESAYYHVVFNLEKFKTERLGKDGKPSKAYSYYGTVVKNHILALKQEADKRIDRYGGIIDIDDIGEHIPDKSRDEKSFEEVKKQLNSELDRVINTKKLNKNDVVVGNTLKYMLTNWHKLEFQNKNEFVRLLCHYTQLKPPVVARSLKKFKAIVYDNIFKPSSKKRKKQKKAEEKPIEEKPEE